MMRKRMKIALVVLIVGIVALLGGFAAADFDLTNLTAGGNMTERQYEAEGDVTELVVRDMNADIVVTPSKDGKALLTCWENEDFTYEISEENGVLRVAFIRTGRCKLSFPPVRRWMSPPTAARCGWKAMRRASPSPP